MLSADRLDTDRRNTQVPATFSTMSLLTDVQLICAARPALDAANERFSFRFIASVPVIEQRPWGQLEWSVSTITWADAALEAITINNPSADEKPDVRRRTVRPTRRLELHALDQEIAPSMVGFGFGGLFTGAAAITETSLPVIAELPILLVWVAACAAIPKAIGAVRRRRRENLAVLRDKGWLPRGSREDGPRRFTFGDVLFDDLKTLVVAMKSIEEATASRTLAANLCSPAWASLWFATGLPRIWTNATDRLVAAGLAAERAHAPHAAVSNEELVALWSDRSWWEPIMANDVAHAKLVRATHLVSGRTATASAGAHPIDTPAAAAAPSALPEIDLEPVRLVHQEVREAFTAFCFDPHAVLARPLLNDVSDDLTAAFYAAREAAEEAETALLGQPDDAGAVRAYRDAVHQLASAWDAADIHARECGVSHLSTGEQNDVRKARRTLDLALNLNTPAGEREAAYRVVLALISGLVQVPGPALTRMVGQIDSVRRRQLTDDRSQTTDGGGGWPSF